MNRIGRVHVLLTAAVMVLGMGVVAAPSASAEVLDGLNCTNVVSADLVKSPYSTGSNSAYASVTFTRNLDNPGCAVISDIKPSVEVTVSNGSETVIEAASSYVSGSYEYGGAYFFSYSDEVIYGDIEISNIVFTYATNFEDQIKDTVTGPWGSLEWKHSVNMYSLLAPGTVRAGDTFDSKLSVGGDLVADPEAVVVLEISKVSGGGDLAWKTLAEAKIKDAVSYGVGYNILTFIATAPDSNHRVRARVVENDTYFKTVTDESSLVIGEPSVPPAPNMYVYGNSATTAYMSWSVYEPDSEPEYDNVTGYRIGWTSASGLPTAEWSTELSAPPSSSVSTYEFTGLAPSTEYTFWVQAKNTGGWGEKSSKTLTTGTQPPPVECSPVYPELCMPPNAPTSEDTSATATSITLDWKAPTKSDGTIIAYQFGWTEVASNITWQSEELSSASADDPYTFTGLKPDTTYKVWVRAKNDKADAWSEKAEETVGTDAVPPPPPAGQAPGAPGATVTAVTDTTITMDWAAPSAPNGTISAYQFGWLSASGKPLPAWDGQYPVAAASDPFVFSNLAPSTEYKVWVRAGNEYGFGEKQWITKTTAAPPVVVTPPATTPAPPAAAPAKAATVKVRSSAKGKKLYLHVDVDPNKGKGYWKFRVQKWNGTTWVNKKVYKTAGKKETRKLRLSAGDYRVVVAGKYGYQGVVSGGVTLAKKVKAPASPPPASAASFAGDGTFAVGSQIAPGTYQSSVASKIGGGYWARLSSASGELDAIIANEFAMDGQMIVTIQPTDKFFQTTRMNRWVKIG